jgi:hypothetical protein
MPDDDDELEQRLQDAEQLLDPVPARLLHGAVGMFDWRTIDADLAALVFDSADARSAAAVRGPGQSRLLTFRVGDLSIELELTGTPPQREISGRLVPARQAAVEILAGGERLTVTADELGRFAAAVPGSGPLSLRLQPGGAGARPVVTEWISG